jgi:UDP-glucose:(heptosyl)LPS alpha-1,3-glucosyltransferase
MASHTPDPDDRRGSELRVALVAEWLDPWRGGAETSTLQFIHHLQGHGVELHVFTRSRPSPSPGMEVHTVPGASMSRVRRSITFAHRVERVLATLDFDVVHAITPLRGADVYQPRGGTIAESIERNLAMRRRPTARVFRKYVGHLNLKQRHLLAAERRLFADPTGPLIIAISDYVAEQLQRHYHLPQDRVRKVFNAVHVAPARPHDEVRCREMIRREFGLADHHLAVLSVAHNFRLKGVQHWLEALARLVGRGVRDVRAFVIGRGDSQVWHRLAARLAVTDFVTFLGPSDRVAQIYHAGDVLVHPTYYDPCSRVVLEALILGLPCVTTRFNGAAEIMTDGHDGYVVDAPNDISALADAARQLANPEHRRTIGDNGRKHREHLDMNRHVREMIQLYEDAYARKNQG